jgi:glycosyltransferase involved in cell wall biosynthesis
MRILITSDIFPPDVGGPATYVPRIAAALTGRGHQVTVMTYSLVQAYAGDSAYPFPVVRVSAAPPRWRRVPRTLSAILAHARHADIIYANGLITESVLANFILHKPIVAKVVGDLAWERSRDKGWIHDGIEHFQTGHYSLKVELMRWRRNLSYGRMDRIIVPSSYLKEMLLKYWPLPAGCVQVVYNSFQASGQELPAAPIELPVKYKLITVCRLIGWKGVDGLIQALPALSDVGLVIVGDGPLHGNLLALAQTLRVETRVYFAGTVPREQVSAYLRACDIFVLNSTYEGLPHVALEAAAAGLPVIATDVGGTREVLQDGVNGQLIPAGDSHALQEAILSWIGRLPVRPSPIPERFSLQHMVQATEDVLQQTLQKQSLDILARRRQ